MVSSDSMCKDKILPEEVPKGVLREVIVGGLREDFLEGGITSHPITTKGTRGCGGEGDTRSRLVTTRGIVAEGGHEEFRVHHVPLLSLHLLLSPPHQTRA